MNFMFIRARYNYIQLIILQRIEGKARFLYSLPFPPSSNGMKWYAMILILIAIPADANFLNGYALNGPVLVGYVLKIRIGGICIGGIRLRFLLMHTFWMDTHWMDTHSMDTYWWDTCWTDTYWWDTYCKTCWCKRFERITLHGYVLVGYVLNGYVLVGYVLVGYVLNGYVWDMCGVMDMCGICVVWDMCGICVVWDMCGICVAWDTPTIFWRTLRRNVFREKSCEGSFCCAEERWFSRHLGLPLFGFGPKIWTFAVPWSGNISNNVWLCIISIYISIFIYICTCLQQRRCIHVL